MKYPENSDIDVDFDQARLHVASTQASSSKSHTNTPNSGTQVNKAKSPSVLAPMFLSLSNQLSNQSSRTFVSTNLNTELEQWNDSNLEIHQLNAQFMGSTARHKKLRQFVTANNLDVIGFSETWLKDFIPDIKIAIFNYIIRHSSTDKEERGQDMLICEMRFGCIFHCRGLHGRNRTWNWVSHR